MFLVVFFLTNSNLFAQIIEGGTNSLIQQESDTEKLNHTEVNNPIINNNLEKMKISIIASEKAKLKFVDVTMIEETNRNKALEDKASLFPHKPNNGVTSLSPKSMGNLYRSNCCN